MDAEARLAGLRILIVDDHEIIREGLKRILSSTAERWQIAEASDGFLALDRLREQEFDLVIVDLTMPGMSGLELIKRIHADSPRLAMMVLSMHPEEQYAMRAFKAGARGYVTKDRAGTELVHAVRKVANGGAYITPSLAERVVLQLTGTAETPRHELLSNRELEVLRRLVKGERLTDIGDALHLSVKTVSTHKTRIQEKLQLPSLAALVRYGVDHGLVDNDPAP